MAAAADAGGDVAGVCDTRDGREGLAAGAPADLCGGDAGVHHYWWLVKTGVMEPLPFTLVLAVLLLARMIWAANKRLRRPTPVAGIVAAVPANHAVSSRS